MQQNVAWFQQWRRSSYRQRQRAESPASSRWKSPGRVTPPASGRAAGFPAPPASEFLARFEPLIVAAALVLFLILGWRGRSPVGVAGVDELIYISVSRSLETGSYKEIHLVDQPLHVRYPPGYPAWLAGLRAIGGESPDLMRGANLVFVAAAILGAYLIVRSVAGLPLALAAILLMAVNPTLLDAGGTLPSEPLFLALVGATLLCTIRGPPAPRGAAYLAIALSLAAFLTRTAGITLVLAVGAWLWSRRRAREMVIYAATSILVVGGWFAYTAAVPRAKNTWSYWYNMSAGLGGDAPGMLARSTEWIWRNASGYATEGLPWVLRVPTVSGTILDNLIWLVLVTVLLLAGLAVLARRARPVALYLILSAALLLTWPYRDDRLLVPLLPCALAALLIGAHRLAHILSPAPRRILLGLFLVVMAFGNVRGALARDAAAARCDRANPYDGPGCYGPESRAIANASAYLRSHAAPGSMVLSLQPEGVNLLTGFLTESAAALRGVPPGEAARELRARGILYVLVAGGSDLGRGRLARNLIASCRELRVETRFGPNDFLLSVLPPRQPSEEACVPLRELLTASQRAGAAPD